MDRLKDKQIGEMWSTNYPRRRENNSWLLLTALVNIIKGNSLIMACKDGGDYSKTLEVSLQQCNVPAHEFSKIEESKSKSLKQMR
jgi:hypothetical protein